MPGPGRETEPGVRLDTQVAALAAAQHAVFALGQLVALGLSERAVQKRTGCGRLHRVHRGVYSLVPLELLTWRGRLMAAVLACGPGAVVSHREAAALHDLRPSNRLRIDITVPGRRRRAVRGVDIHRSLTLRAEDVTAVDGIPCTAIARTHLDLGDVVSQHDVERTLNQAEALNVLNVRALEGQCDRNRHRSAAGVLAAALAPYRPGQAVPEPGAEVDFVALIAAAGLPAPERQAYIDLGDGGPMIRADFAWRAQRLVVETDGERYHRTRRAFESDRLRDQRLARARWTAIRITWRQLRDDPAGIVALIADLLGVDEAA